MKLPEKKWMTINEVAEYLEVSRNTVITIIKKGELKRTRVGAQYKITLADVEKYVKRNTK